MIMQFIKVADKSQICHLARMAQEIWEEYYPSIISQEQIAYMIDTFQSPAAIEKQIEEGMRYYLLTHEERAIGYIGFTVETGGSLFLSKIYLARDFRNKGKGGEAFRFIAEQARKNGCKKIWLTVNKNNKIAIDKYLKIGFTITESVKKDIGKGFYMDDYVMEYIL